ncbi:MAG: histidine kinase N-terminal 7TM domain-containing protein [Patescibacteria group bacterium]
MDPSNFILLGISLINLFLGFFLFLKSRKNLVNISYSIFVFFIFCWGLSLFIFRLTSNEQIALLAMRLSYVSAVLISVPFIYFALIFPGGRLSSYKSSILLMLPAIFVSFLLLNRNFLVKSLVYHYYGKAVLLLPYHYLLFGFCFIMSFFGAWLILWWRYRHSYGIIKTQFLYVLIGILVSGVLGTIFNLILPSPWFINFRWIWLGPSFTIIMVVFIAYAIIRYRLMDIKLVIKRSTVFTLLVVIITATYAFLVVFLDKPLVTIWDAILYSRLALLLRF